MAEGTVTRKVSGVDTVCWTSKSSHTKSGYEHHQADRGEIVELPADQAERLEALGFLVGPDDEVVGASDTAAPAVSSVTDEDIAGMTVEQVNAYIGQIPDGEARDGEIERVVSIENRRDKPRVGVLSLDPDFEPDPDDQA